LRQEYCGKVTKYKKLDDSIHKEHYDKTHQKLTQNAKYAKRMVKVRSKTVEPVLGTLINFLNMKKINSRGIKQANKHVLMAALTYNLKKYLKFIAKKSKIDAGVLSQEFKEVQATLKRLFQDQKRTILRLLIFANPNLQTKTNLA
jgi:hypothetical protein